MTLRQKSRYRLRKLRSSVFHIITEDIESSLASINWNRRPIIHGNIIFENTLL
jgi:hypothetical protein